MTRPANRYRLTDAGKRLYWIYRHFNQNRAGENLELTPDEFIVILQADPIAVGGVCLSCGTGVDYLCGGSFCITCVRATYKSK